MSRMSIFAFGNDFLAKGYRIRAVIWTIDRVKSNQFEKIEEPSWVIDILCLDSMRLSPMFTDKTGAMNNSPQR